MILWSEWALRGYVHVQVIPFDSFETIKNSPRLPKVWGPLVRREGS